MNTNTDGVSVMSAELCKTQERWPETAADVRAFVGSDYNTLRFGKADQSPDENDTYSMSAHDILSAIRNWRVFVLGHDA